MAAAIIAYLSKSPNISPIILGVAILISHFLFLAVIDPRSTAREECSAAGTYCQRLERSAFLDRIENAAPKTQNRDKRTEARDLKALIVAAIEKVFE